MPRIDNPSAILALVFLGWKTLLLLLAVGSQVGPAYDSSSSLLLHHYNTSSAQAFVGRLTSWDAIYFVKSAQRGYLFEQEWAFGSALPACIASIIRVLQHVGLVSTPSSNPVSLVSSIGVVIAHVCHLASCFVLYQLGLLIWDEKTWALAAALLHVFSPAGLFLSAPYAESPHSLLAFVGWLLLARSCTRPRSHGALAPATSHLLTLLSGIVFGLATVLRSNGLLNGLPFACDFLVTFYCLVEDPELSRTPAYLIKLGVVGLSGLFVAAGYAGPQVWAYKTYCSGSLAQPRPWCRDLLPSIYSYVQRQYWNTGFLRYWTVSNAPLFLLAAPMLFFMSKGGKDIILHASKIPDRLRSRPDIDSTRLEVLVKSMAAVQLMIVFLTLTSYHVQIITRLSSGYPAWYWWGAACLRAPKTRRLGGVLLTFALVYAMIQGVLFASFLPPA